VADAEGRHQERISAMLRDVRDVRGEPVHAERLAIKDDGRIFFVRTREIDWIEAAGNYVRLYCGGTMHLMRSTLSALEARLDPERFLRIHRSRIVNLDSVAEIQPMFHGEHVVIMADGTRLTLSRGYRQRLDSLLG
jgi:two-component system LytT family response regulator